MLVFISDIHLTDGTSGTTISSGAFEKLCFYLEDIVDTIKAKELTVEELEVAFLGDIFDVIRSDYWLKSNIRPWSNPEDKDGYGKGLKDYTEEIVKRICNNSTNKESMNHLKEFRNGMDGKGVAVKFIYIVGNHDWLINRYSGTREMIAKLLGMDNPDYYIDNPFLTEKFWEDYRVFARHGDVYDPFNFDGNRDASSLGDAIVIDLINKFPTAAENDIGPDTDPQLISQLREIDNVRPLIDIPLWVQGVCSRSRYGERVKEVWNNVVDNFLKIDFVKSHDKWGFDVVDALQLGLKITKYLSFKNIARLPIRKFQRTRDDYRDKAFQEGYTKRNEAEFVIYGHTHSHEIQPLDQVPIPIKGEILHKTYFNTGTWRRVHVRTAYDVENLEFSSWDVMTFIAFYLDNERDKKDMRRRKFEVWNGALG